MIDLLIHDGTFVRGERLLCVCHFPSPEQAKVYRQERQLAVKRGMTAVIRCRLLNLQVQTSSFKGGSKMASGRKTSSTPSLPDLHLAFAPEIEAGDVMRPEAISTV
jgi:hypothetical protein